MGSDRSDHAPRSDRMPRPGHSPRTSPAPIATLIADLTRFQREEATVRQEYPWAERFVMGLPLAPWQRELKWDAKQLQRFITSVWTGVPLGSYLLTEAELGPGSLVRFLPLSNCVLDGQQRLFALQQYLTSNLAVPDVNGVETLWCELDVREQRWFSHRTFERATMPLRDERPLKEVYDLLNYGGVAHQEHERALAPLA